MEDTKIQSYQLIQNVLKYIYRRRKDSKLSNKNVKDPGLSQVIYNLKRWKLAFCKFNKGSNLLLFTQRSVVYWSLNLMAEINIIVESNINLNFIVCIGNHQTVSRKMFFEDQREYMTSICLVIMQVNICKEHTYIHPCLVISNYSWLETSGRVYKVEFPYTDELLIKAQFQNLTARKRKW